MKVFALLGLICLVPVWARPGGGERRRIKMQIKEQIAEAVKDLPCEEKNAVFDAYLEKDFGQIGQLLGLDLPELPEKPGKGDRHAEKREMIKDALADVDCETKSLVFDAKLSRDHEAIEELLGIDLPERKHGGKGGKWGRKHEEKFAKFKEFHDQVLQAIEGKSCEEVGAIFDAKLALDKDKLEELTGVAFPDFGHSSSSESSSESKSKEHWKEKKLEFMAKLKEQVDTLDCDQKAAAFKAMLQHDKEALAELGIEFPKWKHHGRGGRKGRGHHRGGKHEKFSEFHKQVQAAIEGKSCEEVGEIFDTKLALDKDKLEELTGVAFPDFGHSSSSESHGDWKEKKLEFMAQIKEQVDKLDCEGKAAAFRAMLDHDEEALAELGVEFPKWKHHGRGGRRGRGHRGGKHHKKREFHRQLVEATEGMSCEEVGEVFDAKLALDKDKLEELTGVEFPERSHSSSSESHEERMERKRENMAAIKANVDLLDCEDKASAFRALMEHDTETLKALGIEKPPHHGKGYHHGRSSSSSSEEDD